MTSQLTVLKDLLSEQMSTSSQNIMMYVRNMLVVNHYIFEFQGFVTINGKRVNKADIEADNGVIHMVTDVIYPFPTGNIAEVVTGDERFSTLLAAVGAAGLAETLATGGPFTVFAPTNDAFAKVPKDALDGLLADKEALTKVLLRHVLPGALFYKGITWDTHNTAGGAEEDMIATQVFKAGVVKVVSSVGAREQGPE